MLAASTARCSTKVVLGPASSSWACNRLMTWAAAYAIGEARKWPVGLGRRPMEAKAFYATLAIATLVGMITPVNPIKGLLLDGGDQWHCRGAVMAMMMARPFSE